MSRARSKECILTPEDLYGNDSDTSSYLGPSLNDLPSPQETRRPTFDTCPHECPECVEKVRMTIDSHNGDLIAEKIAELYLLGHQPVINITNHYAVRNDSDLKVLMNRKSVPDIHPVLRRDGPDGPSIIHEPKRSFSLNDVSDIDLRISTSGPPRDDLDLGKGDVEKGAAGKTPQRHTERTTIEYTKRLRSPAQCPSMKSNSKSKVWQPICGSYVTVVQSVVILLAICLSIGLLYVLTLNFWQPSNQLEAPPY